MKLTAQYRFPFDVCFEDPGSPEIIQFEIGFSWRVPLLAERWPGLYDRFETIQVTHKESCFCLDDDGLQMIGLPLRYQGFKDRFVLGRGTNRRRFRYRSVKPGGNMYWESIRMARQSEPHLFNYLRRQKVFDFSEWDTEFVDEVWKRRGTIRREHLDRWAWKTIKRWLAQEAIEAGYKTVKEWLEVGGLAPWRAAAEVTA